jgi:hypothetical protein
MVFTLGAPGPQGPAGPQGNPGPQGQPGVGVPTGGSIGQLLTKTGAPDFATGWTTLSLAGYATESWVQAGFYPLTGNPSGFITNAALAPYLTSATAASTYQTLAGMSAYATQSFVTSQGYITSAALAPYLLASTAASTYQTIAGMSVYATQSFVTSQGYITSAALAGYATESWVLLKNYIPYDNVGIYVNGQEQTVAFNGTQLGLTLEADPEAYRTSLGLGTMSTEAATDYARRDGTTFTGTVNFGAFVTSNSTFQFVGGGFITMLPTVTSNPTSQYSSNGIQITGGTGSGLQAQFREGGVTLDSFGANPGTTTIRAGTPSSFGAKLNCTMTATTAALNIGAMVSGNSPTTTVAGDIWISQFNLGFRTASGAIKFSANLSDTNTFSAPQIIDTTATTPALRVTQKGTGNSLLVEDSTTPDTSALVVDASGNIGIGVATGYTSTSKVEVVGNVKADTFSNGAGPTFSINSTAAHTGGPNSLDAIVTIGGVNYRISLRPA